MTTSTNEEEESAPIMPPPPPPPMLPIVSMTLSASEESPTPPLDSSSSSNSTSPTPNTTTNTTNTTTTSYPSKVATDDPMDLVCFSEDDDTKRVRHDGRKLDPVTWRRLQAQRTRSLRKMLTDPVRQWKLLPISYRRDKQFVLEVLAKADKLPSKSDFERSFPQSLRFDKDVVIGFCLRPDFVQLYYDRHLYVPGCLSADVDVMKLYCSKIPRQLQECHVDLCDNIDVVQSALTLDGLELQYASLQLQEKEELVRMACAHNGKAFDFVPTNSPTRLRLLQDRDFLMTVVKNGGGMIVTKLPKECVQLANDEELLLTAVSHGLDLRYVPAQYQENMEFVKMAVCRSPQMYLNLSPQLQRKPQIARAAILGGTSTDNATSMTTTGTSTASNTTNTTTTPDVIAKAFVHLDDHDRESHVIALAISKYGQLEFMKTYLHNRPLFLRDKIVMMEALRREPDLFAYCHTSLRTDEDIVISALSENSVVNILRSLPATWLQHHVNIVIRGIEVCHKNGLRNLPIPQSLWTNRDLQIMWITKGGRIQGNDDIVRVLTRDRELSLLVAEHNHVEFHHVGLALRSDLEFMKCAVSKNGHVFRQAGTAALKSNMELAVLAVANKAHALQQQSGSVRTNTNRNGGNNGNITITKSQLKKYVEQHLDLHKVFVQDVLRGMTRTTATTNTNATNTNNMSRDGSVRHHLSSASASSALINHDYRPCQLELLDRGIETGTAFKQLIAQFLGVPVGDRLTKFRQCLDHLVNPPPLSSSDTATAADPAAWNNQPWPAAIIGGGGAAGAAGGAAAARRLRRPPVPFGLRAGLGRGIAAADDDDDDDDMMMMAMHAMMDDHHGMPMPPPRHHPRAMMRMRMNNNNRRMMMNANANAAAAAPGGGGGDNPNNGGGLFAGINFGFGEARAAAVPAVPPRNNNNANNQDNPNPNNANANDNDGWRNIVPGVWIAGDNNADNNNANNNRRALPGVLFAGADQNADNADNRGGGVRRVPAAAAAAGVEERAEGALFAAHLQMRAASEQRIRAADERLRRLDDPMREADEQIRAIRAADERLRFLDDDPVRAADEQIRAMMHAQERMHEQRMMMMDHHFGGGRRGGGGMAMEAAAAAAEEAEEEEELFFMGNQNEEENEEEAFFEANNF